MRMGTYPTALYSVLDRPSIKTLHHVGDLMGRDPKHMSYVWYPIYNRTALQMVAKENGQYHSPHYILRPFSTLANASPENFISPHEVASVLQELIEYYLDDDEDIDATDDFGPSALFYAADYTCPEATKVLLEAGADPLLTHKIKMFLQIGLGGQGGTMCRQQTEVSSTAYEFVLQVIFRMFKQAEKFGMPLDRSKFWIPSRFANDADGTLSSELVKRFDTLAALSYAVDSANELPEYFLADDVAGGDLSEWKVKGLVPRTPSVRLELVEAEDGSVHLEAWGLYLTEEWEFSLHIALSEELTGDEIGLKRAQHKAKFDPSDPACMVCYAMTCESSPHVYLYLVTRLLDWEGGAPADAAMDDFVEDEDGMLEMNRMLKQFGIDIKGKVKSAE
jgi:hypothetical protein